MPTAALQVRNDAVAAGDQSSGAGNYTLSGTVVDAVTGAPISRALVTLYRQGAQLVLTDQGGKFQFENLAQGECAIHAQKPGYSDPSGGQATTVAVGAGATPVVVKLEPESGITVKVTGEDGEGAEGLPVRLLRSQVQEGHAYWEPRGGGQTDEQGEFRAGNLPPGKYYVAVGPSFRPVGHVGEGAQESDLGYPRVYYPNADDLAAAAPVEVNAGRRARLEFTVNTVRVYRISGAVVGGPPGQRCGVLLTDNSGEGMAVGLAANPITGIFRSGEIPAGFYTLVAQCNPNRDGSFAGRLPLRVDSNISNLTVAVAPTLSIAVNFRADGGSAEGNENTPAGAVLFRQKQSAAAGIAAWSEAGKDGDDSRMVMKRVEPGTYSVEVRPSTGWYVEAARSGSVDLLTGDLTVPEGGATEAIEITLRNDGASVSGNVKQGGVAVASGSVLLVPDHAAWLVRAAEVTNGTYAIADLAPGSYHAIAFDRVDDLEYTNPEALKDYMAKAQDVTLSGKQEAHMDLELLQREK